LQPASAGYDKNRLPMTLPMPVYDEGRIVVHTEQPASAGYD
jgi:hypothetical protein